MTTLHEQQTGLAWERTTFSIEPRWTVAVDLDAIKEEIEIALDKKQCQVSFFNEGAFNKLYTVRTDSETLIMRVSLPVDPYWKNASEVATTAWVRQNTTLPVPKIIAYNTSRNNAIKFEWILMTMLPGKALSTAWQSISLEAKRDLIRKLANWSSKLFEQQASGIGNIYLTDANGLPDTNLPNGLGRIVSLEFLWGNRLRYGVSRGPFQTSKHWLTARLSLIENDCRSAAENPESDDDDLEDAERTLRIAQKLQKILQIVFPDEEPRSESSMLHHDDLSLHNIMVNTDGLMTGVVDWECVSWVPLWKACYYPTFLQGRHRRSVPDRDSYRRNGEDESDSLYWEHLMEYERTLLRHEFVESVRCLQPGWVNVFETCAMQRSFDYAVDNCDNEFLARDIEEWVDGVAEKGISLFDLRDRIQAC